MSEILICMPENWYDLSLLQPYEYLTKYVWHRLPPGTDKNDMHHELMDAYISSLKPGTNNPTSPLVEFIMTVAEVNQSTCHAVCNSGFLDVLACMYACNFSSGRYGGDPESGQNDIKDTICTALVRLCGRLDAKEMILAHPISVLWPRNRQLLPIFGD